MSSIQHSLTRIRPPRVQITYDVEIGGAVEKKELPFVVGIFADLAGENAAKLPILKDRNFAEIDRDNFNSILSSIAPKITIEILDLLCGKDKKTRRISLSFTDISHFDPVAIVRQVPELNDLFTSRTRIVDLLAKIDGNDAFAAEVFTIIKDKTVQDTYIAEADKPDAPKIKEMLMKSGALKDESALIFMRDMIVNLAKLSASYDTTDVINEYGFLMLIVSDIDAKISKQLDEILHTKEFQKLEASWRGLYNFVMNTETSARLKLRILCITKNEIIDDLDKAIEFDQSLLFKKIYEQEYGTLGGIPYSCLIGDYAFDNGAQDVKLLRNISTIAAAAHAPFITNASHDIFNIENFSQLSMPRDLAKMFESSDFAAWRGFRDTEDARYVNLLLPRVLVRLPYGQKTIPCQEFNYEENVDGSDNQKFCWGLPSFSMAQKITAAFAEYGWTTAIRGVEGGGKVDQLPTYTYKTSKGDMEMKCPSEVAITDRREKELSDLGFISLCHAKGTDYAVFFGSQSIQKPKKYNLSEATANAAISARLPYMLNASRFAHYVKIMMRDKIGSFMTASEIEVYLQNWLADYVLLSDDAPQALKAQYPLREGKVNVVEVPGNPGTYKAVLFLRPHFQLEELTVSLRLVASLGGGA